MPDILSKLVPLKNKLRKRFPKSKRGKLGVWVKQRGRRTRVLKFSLPLGSVGVHIPKMLDLFKTGHEYLVENERYIRTQIATVRPSDRLTPPRGAVKHTLAQFWFKRTGFSDDRVFPSRSSTCPKSTSSPTCGPSCWTSAPTDPLTWVGALKAADKKIRRGPLLARQLALKLKRVRLLSKNPRRSSGPAEIGPWGEKRAFRLRSGFDYPSQARFALRQPDCFFEIPPGSRRLFCRAERSPLPRPLQHLDTPERPLQRNVFQPH